MFFKIKVAGFSTATPGKLLCDILILPRSTLARRSVLLLFSSREKCHEYWLIPRKELLSTVHLNFAVDPGRNVIRVPSGGDVIFAKPKKRMSLYVLTVKMLSLRMSEIDVNYFNINDMN